MADQELSSRARTRLGDAGRDRPLGVLQRAYAKGQLPREEFEQRVERSLAAQIRHQLRRLLDDLQEYQEIRSNPRMHRFWLD